jgi:3-hydroxybutyryl-CoA dehydrogenase
MALDINQINRIAVIGAGTMGLGIAQISALAGYDTILFDINAEQLEKAKSIIEKNLAKGVEKGKVTEEAKVNALAKLSFTTNNQDLVADVIIEAVLEKLAIKQSIFKECAAINPPETILATNTSSIPISQIAQAIDHPERVIGMHFFNPAHIMKLVEVISGASTAAKVAETIKALAEKLGKQAVKAADAPGFIVNRVARHFHVESLKVLEERVTDHAGVDRLLESSGFKMGPFKLQDLIGIDTNYSVTSAMFESFNFDPKFRPSRVQKAKIDAGHIGRKSGKGFYEY